MRTITPRARQLLDELDKIFSSSDKDTATDLWNVLTALRGPDIDFGWGSYAKMATVMVRQWAFPITYATAKKNNGTRFSNRPLFSTHSKNKSEKAAITPYTPFGEPGARHFEIHAIKAWQILGLPVPPDSRGYVPDQGYYDNRHW